jgi:hypothetical protein
MQTLTDIADGFMPLSLVRYGRGATLASESWGSSCKRGFELRYSGNQFEAIK